MKVNTKTTWLMVAFTLVYTCLLLSSVISRMDNKQPTNLLMLFLEIFYIIPIIYMTTVLKYLNEKKSIIITYTVYVISDVLFMLFYLLIGKNPAYAVIYIVLILVSIVITQIMAIQSFRIKTRQIKVSYCIYAVLFFLLIFTKFVGIILSMVYHINSVFKFTTPLEMLFSVAIFYSLFQIFRYLKTEKATPDVIANRF
ncbi:hypothetical protein [Mucilaginibacter celer]|uniref:Uncharacterized protein n=1 Tax=Mucilaginibacter celer TaxID=2305508 RepID=A0A494VSE0_9SPHI|nr:hypothetical protein [Mucilaginibacter celer]AYL96310.1 hypothetical protein HYN43_013850 [Mucilaginibacter celer]